MFYNLDIQNHLFHFLYSGKPRNIGNSNDMRKIKDVKVENDKMFRKLFREENKGQFGCFTCDYVGLDLQLGHYIPRGSKKVAWDLDNCRWQCFRCNNELRGNVKVFRERLIDDIGIERVLELESWKNKPVGSEFIREVNRELKDLCKQ